MNKLFLTVMVMAMVAVSCKKNEKSGTIKSESTQSSAQLYACPMHPEVSGKKGEACSECGMELTEPVTHKEATHEHQEGDMHEEANVETTNSTVQSSFSINEIVSGYLNIKNALVKDDSKEAATAGKALDATFSKVNSNEIDVKLKKEYEDIAHAAKEHALHIADNSGKIDHQRAHFVMLSKDINDLITAFGTKQKLYQDFCPMADNDKGAMWISETKDIKNPYFGSQMLSCGSVKKEW
jgi:hypothetical protein